VLDPREADTVEELAELATSYFDVDLDASRCTVLHGDEQHARPAVQAFSGFKVHELDVLDWIQWTWGDKLQPPGSWIQLEPADFRGRHAVLIGLHRPHGEFLGLLQLDREKPFGTRRLSSLRKFTDLYSQRLHELIAADPDGPVSVEAGPATIVQEDLFHPEMAWMDTF
jgi:hypothetical protein